jgi:NAD+ diphosphatase
VYPRISPAMMVLVTRGRELLLGRGINFPPGRYSALAGFLEAGETIEEAVHREVREEVNVEGRQPALLRQPELAVPQFADDRVPG